MERHKTLQGSQLPAYLHTLTQYSQPLNVSTDVDTLTGGREMQSEIKRWGNSAAVRLPSKILSQAQLSIASPIQIEVIDGKIVIQAAVVSHGKIRLPFSEADLLVGLDANTAHADDLAQPLPDEMGRE